MKEVKVKIKGKQLHSNGEKDTIELITEGKFYKKNGAYYIVYDETEISGMEGSTTTLKIQDQKILMNRFGTNKSKLVFEKGRRHQTQYGTAYGNMTMQVHTSKMEVDISDTGKGNIDLSYKLNISDSIESKNNLSINIM